MENGASLVSRRFLSPRDLRRHSVKHSSISLVAWSAKQDTESNHVTGYHLYYEYRTSMSPRREGGEAMGEVIVAHMCAIVCSVDEYLNIGKKSIY
ncbi:hypothetical protein BgiBS90_012438 [Biomphalaria glabrata]|nr:hypothetical protein BgiBS90_012438 [Biomphalaria glabrata]